MRKHKTITLYHGSTSVCSAKVRAGLFEKGLDWQGELLDLKAGEQFAPAYLALNPNGVVPTLVHGDLVVLESSLILEYIDGLSDQNPLMPTDPKAIVATRHWLLKCLDIHAAINSMTYATIQRSSIVATKTPEEVAAMIARIPNPKAAAKRRDLIDNGLDSSHVDGDLHTLSNTFKDMSTALHRGKWLAGDRHSMADIALIAYIDRLDRLGLERLWSGQFPEITEWLEACRLRQSYQSAIATYSPEELTVKMRAEGSAHWPSLEQKWKAHLEKQ